MQAYYDFVHVLATVAPLNQSLHELLNRPIPSQPQYQPDRFGAVVNAKVDWTQVREDFWTTGVAVIDGALSRYHLVCSVCVCVCVGSIYMGG